ncbi:MAG: T9SS type A sorting domain-containing protein, partial [Bacteroidota bacterium]|nr:T9SS type A sorting domain-containing protein [Bacteroidota bacterium]
LAQNYPNPFNPSTSIKYSIPQNSMVSLKVYDILGKEVASLVNEQKSAGSYEVNFNANSLSAGMYIYELKAGNFTQTKKMMLIK